MSNNTYSVPSLSLSSSRSKKYIPTKDTPKQKILSSNPYRSQFNKFNDMNPSSTYSQQLQQGNKNIAKINNISNIPKPRSNQFRPPIFNKNQVKQINRNVYLNNQQMDDKNKIQNHIFFNQNLKERSSNQYLIQKNIDSGTRNNIKQEISKSNSSQFLLRNPESHYQVKEQINRHSNVQFKKIDVNKVLFQRKINKLIQQAMFYDDQLDSFYKEICKNQIQELQNIANSSMKVHQEMLSNLSSLTI